MNPLKALLSEVARCRICEASLPLGPNPILQCSASAKVLIAGQAPGRKVHASGAPFDDPSGDRLREWMGISRDAFYNADKIAILPMGFCYPGTGKSGDLPPRPECAIQWRASLLGQMKQVELTLVMGQYAQQYHFGSGSSSLTELVKSWQDYWPAMIPLPHPSPRNNRWLKTNPWFENEVLPELKIRIKQVLKGHIDE
jgi:uracil-DNA glycosylase